jgi:uncharacterized protein YodC (DUF2158 family)
MATFKVGDAVKLKTVVPQGTVQSMRMDESGNISYLFAWTDMAGDEHQRWFDEAELELA